MFRSSSCFKKRTNVLTYYSIFFIVIVISIASCRQQSSTSERAMLFLRRIDSVYYSIDERGDLFDVYNQKLVNDFAKNNRLPLAKQQIDSLISLFDDYMSAIDFGKQKIYKIPEFDTAFSIVRKNILFLQSQKIFWNKWVPRFISLYRIGWENLGDSEKIEIIQSAKQMKESQSTANKLIDDLLLLDQKFAKKYGFNYVPRAPG